MEADQVGRLRDILAAARLIASYVKDTSYSEAMRKSASRRDASQRAV